jgi:methyltransferase (TIGR00027 family)
MKLGQSTNKGTAMLKLIHQFEDQVLVPDEFLPTFFDESERAIAQENYTLLKQPAQTEADQFLQIVYWYVVLREKHGDEAIIQAIYNGCRQLVLLGSGYDTRFFKLSEIQANRVPTFEVDLPNIIQQKQAYLLNRFNPLPTDLHFIPLDFNHEDLNRLIDQGVDPEKPTIYVWQGVSYYLPQENVAKMLDFVRLHMSPGSWFVFDCCTPLMTFKNDQVPGIGYNIDELTKIGEPYVFGMEPDAMQGWLLEKGFHDIEILNQTELEQRYLKRQTLPDTMWYVVTCK